MNPNDLEIFSDVGSGLNDERKNFKKVLNKIMSGEVDRLFVLYKDRLARFGFGQIEEVCNILELKLLFYLKMRNLNR